MGYYTTAILALAIGLILSTIDSANQQKQIDAIKEVLKHQTSINDGLLIRIVELQTALVGSPYEPAGGFITLEE